MTKSLQEKYEEVIIGLGCDYCVIPHDYKTAKFKIDTHGKKVCNYCEHHHQKKFKGLKQLKEDINLKTNEKIGVMVSGSKDGLFAWMILCDLIGSDKVIAFNHHKTGLVHDLAYKNIINASKILNSKLVVIKDNEFLLRFKNNLEAFFKSPDPSMVRVALCAGCRYGITGNLYNIADSNYNITKFVSAASYLELAPFKNELLKEKGNGNSKYGLIRGLAENVNYNFSNNIEIILKDDNLEYKSKAGSEKKIASEFHNYQLFDLDDYIANDPEKYERAVKKRLGWERPDKSWHFDCIIEDFKDFFYYGLLGYTENEFRLSQMIRYNLLSRDEAIKEIYLYRKKMKTSLNIIIKHLELLDLLYLKKDFINFYNKSQYFNPKNIDQQL